jgi:hypothetical protein
MTLAPTRPGGLDLSHSAKVYLAICFVLSTVATSGINAWMTHHFGIIQADDATKKADVRKIEDQISQFDQLVRGYVMGVNDADVSAVRREAVLANAQSQYDFLGTLIPILKADSRQSVEAYRNRLIEISSTLRKSRDIPTTQAFAQSVSYAVDERARALDALRRDVGLPQAAAAETPHA